MQQRVNQKRAPLRKAMVPCLSLLLMCLLSASAQAHGLEPDPVIDRLPALEFIRQTDSGFITSSGGKHYQWTSFRNYAYACGRRGFHTFLVARPLLHNGAWDDGSSDLPLLMRLRGGGVGYFDAHHIYHGNGNEAINTGSPAQTPLDEEGPELLRAHLVSEGLMQRVTSDPEVDYRILVVSYCDHDVYSGVGQVDPNNPFSLVDNPLTEDREDQPRTTDGLLAVKAAFQFTKDHNTTRNRQVVLYGTSAGGVGALSFATSFGRKGVGFAGVVADSGDTSPWADGFVRFGCNPWMQPADSFLSGISTRVGPYLTPQLDAVSTSIDGTLRTPVFLIWNRGDKVSCGETEIAIDSDHDGRDELFWPGSEVLWRPFAKVIDSHNPGDASRWLRVCVEDEVYQGPYDGPCDQHSPTLYEKRDSDASTLHSSIESSARGITDPRRTYDGSYNDEIYAWIRDRIGY